MSSAEHETAGRRCAVCGEIVGVYESLVILAPGEAPLRGSFAAENGLPQGSVLLHEGCFARRREPAPSSTESTLHLSG